MTDTLNRRSIEIRTVSEQGAEGRGSGFPVGHGLVMTCAHVVLSKKSVWVRWCELPDEDLPPELETNDYEVLFPTGERKVHKFVRAEEIFAGDPKEFDIALLKTFHPDGFDYFSLSTLGGEVGEAVCGIGFPKATKTAPFRSVPLNGKVAQAPSRDKGGLLQIGLDARAEDPEDWRGASGAPVVLRANMTVIGVHQITAEYLANANTVWAVPSHTILAHDELGPLLRNAACTEEALERVHRAHIRRMRTRIEIELERLEPRHRSRLASQLGIDAKSDDTLERCAGDLSQNAKRALEVLSRLWGDYSGQPVQNNWCALIHLVATCILQRDQAGILILGPMGAIPQEFAVGNPSSLEVTAAQIDGRRVDFTDSRRSEAEMPVGRHALNFLSAEGGPDPDNEAATAERDLMLRCGLKVATDPGRIESYLAREPLLTGPRRNPITDEDRRDLAGVFRRASMVPGGSTYY
ncbi:S1 family peptidase, partial [Rhodovulum sulfidophilum]|uniref:S1 family peptidase n=1 Tax=Rhodovulum sulfidophilum TaxID=35806 RepID=UPI00138A3BA1